MHTHTQLNATKSFKKQNQKLAHGGLDSRTEQAGAQGCGGKQPFDLIMQRKMDCVTQIYTVHH